MFFPVASIAKIRSPPDPRVMKTTLSHQFDRLRETIWFLPLLCVIGAIALAIGARWADWEFNDLSEKLALGLQPRSPDGVRAVLATIGSTMIGLAGVSFSITVVALSLASSQFGSRLLRNFTRDWRNHVVLGILMGVFVYALTLLATVRGGDTEDFETPAIGLIIAFLLAILGLGAFTFFVNLVATSIQAPHVVSRVHDELCTAIDRFFPHPGDDDTGTAHLTQAEIDQLPHRDLQVTEIPAPKSGYLQAIAAESLSDIAASLDAVIEVIPHPGCYLIEGNPIARLYSGKFPDDDVPLRVGRTFLTGATRTTEQDYEFAIAQLVEVAVRAMSPGINDPFTALTCIDRLGSAYARIADRQMPGNAIADADGNLRVLLEPVHFSDVLAAGIAQVRQNSKNSPAVAIRLLEMLAELIPRLRGEASRDAVLAQARATAHSASEGPVEPLDKDVISERLDRVEQLITKARS